MTTQLDRKEADRTDRAGDTASPALSRPSGRLDDPDGHALSIWRSAVEATLSGDRRRLDSELNRYAVWRAREACGQLAHEGARCTCRLGEDPADDRRDLQVAASALPVAHHTVFKKWTEDGAKGRVAGVRMWLRSGARQPFLTYDAKVLAHGRATDVHQSWNVERGWWAKAEARDRLRGDDLDRVGAALAMLDVPAGAWDDLAAACTRKEIADRPDWLAPVQDPRLWVEAMYNDATQPSAHLVDVERVLRWLTWAGAGKAVRPIDAQEGDGVDAAEDREERRLRLLALVARVTEAVDVALSVVNPDRHDAWLGRPRQQTRPAGALAGVATTVSLEVVEQDERDDITSDAHDEDGDW